jgi:hypothetical protein
MHISLRSQTEEDFESAPGCCARILRIVPGQSDPVEDGTKMKTMTVLMLSSMAALASAQYAQADEASAATDQHAANEVYAGVDAEGRRVKVTIAEGGPELFVRVDRRPALPQAHWTALIGTGAAASVER